MREIKLTRTLLVRDRSSFGRIADIFKFKVTIKFVIDLRDSGDINNFLNRPAPPDFWEKASKNGGRPVNKPGKNIIGCALRINYILMFVEFP